MDACQLLETMEKYSVLSSTPCADCPVAAIWGLGSYKGPRMLKIVSLSCNTREHMLSLVTDATGERSPLSFGRLYDILQKLPDKTRAYDVYIQTKPEARESAWSWVAYTPVMKVALTHAPRLFAAIPQLGGILVKREGTRIGSW